MSVKLECCKYCERYQPDETIILNDCAVYRCTLKHRANPQHHCGDYKPDLQKLCRARDRHVEELRAIVDYIAKMEAEA